MLASILNDGPTGHVRASIAKPVASDLPRGLTARSTRTLLGGPAARPSSRRLAWFVGRHRETPETLGDRMKDDRKGVVVDPEYVHALGTATLSFASCEWQVVWCCEKIRPGSLAKITAEEMTAGQIAEHFADVARNMRKGKQREELKQLAQTFLRLVSTRNDIVHGKPCTGPNGKTRLSGSTKVIEISDLEDAADSFMECSGKLNRLFYGFLHTYVPL